jgi:hypothetical protein
MTRYYRRTSPGRRENLGAALVAAGLAGTIAAASFYIVRLFLAREPLEELEAGAATEVEESDGSSR